MAVTKSGRLDTNIYQKEHMWVCYKYNKY